LATTLGHETSHAIDNQDIGYFGCNGFIGFVEFVYFTEEVFEFCSIGIDYLLDGRGYNTSINYTNNKRNAKTKVLATLGSGNIQIADIDQNNSKSNSAIWILPLPRVARTLVLALCLLLV
jgi:hypothetical protein